MFLFLARNFNIIPNKVLRVNSLALLLALGGRVQSFSTECNVSIVQLPLGEEACAPCERMITDTAVFGFCHLRGTVWVPCPQLLIVLSEHFMQAHGKEMWRGCRLPGVPGPPGLLPCHTGPQLHFKNLFKFQFSP